VSGGQLEAVPVCSFLTYGESCSVRNATTNGRKMGNDSTKHSVKSVETKLIPICWGETNR
jgi:hypothetical protein